MLTEAANRSLRAADAVLDDILRLREEIGLDYLLVGDELLRRLGMDEARQRLAPMLNGSRAGEQTG